MKEAAKILNKDLKELKNWIYICVPDISEIIFNNIYYDWHNRKLKIRTDQKR